MSIDLSIIYAVTFGAIVAFGMYLPVLLSASYNLALSDAAYRAAGFIFLATGCRPVGGWLADRFGGQRIITVTLLAIIGLATAMAFESYLTLTTTATFLLLAMALGTGCGAVIALAAKLSPPADLGRTIGIIGAVGGLGGFLPPIFLGLSWQAFQSYTPAILALPVVTVVVFFFIQLRFRTYVK